MDKYLLSNNCFKPFNLEENNSKKRPPKNILGNSEKYIKDDNSISRSDEKLSELKNTLGYFRVTKQPSKTCTQGFIWCYRYFEDGKRKSISNTDLEKLKEIVVNKGLEWRKVL